MAPFPARRRASCHPALNIVLDDLDEVHARNPEIGAKPLVLLPDRPDLDISYEYLLKLEARYGLDHSFDPEAADRSYTVRELLEGVRRDESGQEGDHRKRYRISAGDNAHITVVEGGVRGGGAQIGQRLGRDDSGKSWRSAVGSWRYFSIACGLGAVVLALVIWSLPSNEWRAIVGGLVGLGVLVTAFMLSMNPTYFYRRTLSYVIPAGLLLNAVGFTVDVIAPGGRFQWNGAVSGWFFVAWAAVVGCLVVGDIKQSR